jgi:hypothetical protein
MLILAHCYQEVQQQLRIVVLVAAAAADGVIPLLKFCF